MSTIAPIFLQHECRRGACGFAISSALRPIKLMDDLRAYFLSGIIQRSGPFAAVDVKAKGKH
ncbi:hypothetical protein [Rhizobium binae]|uniref:hypothetical protein n=1 Tax=Rhizobium binae TaxID=1138190 RepID=UPI001C8294E0|nr:hypothetical protein [Rhizobium binae]MBX4939190.1 hypothetical protein [Rhizobium binae]MBX4945706.1 hypothetical protein [Rhizobium binae]MBX4964915.1 hypothetical protein [Rhizobium binae]MBX4981151.1 hypothetical protein [Rhizobium binae]